MMFTPFAWIVCSMLFGAESDASPADVSPQDMLNFFALDGASNIMDEEHFGIVNGKLTVGVNYKDVGSISGLWAPPYVSSDFILEPRVSGEKVATKQYRWCVFEVERSGTAQDVSVSSMTALIPKARAGIMVLSLENTRKEPCSLLLEFVVKGTLDRTDDWEFSRAQSKTPTDATAHERTLKRIQGPLAIILQTDIGTWQWDAAASSWRTTLSLAPDERKTVNVAFAIGDSAEASSACAAVLRDPVRTLADAKAEHVRRVQDLLAKLPRLESSNAALVRFYNRSLVHFLMNRWDVPEFLLQPYYSTGSVKGGCVCNYLWDFGEVWEILPLYDPQAAREHIKQFLKTDITTHFAFKPITGEAFGPWYPVNQEKIIGLIYFYVKNTGDMAFLNEVVNGKSVLDWAVSNAMHGDDLAKPVALIDYGPSNSHLELRRGFPYNHVMPDLNGRRYANYLRACELADLAGKPAPYLKERAAALKDVLKQKLWNPDAKWFWFQNEKGENDLRYTVQMFKLFSSAVLDAEEEAGLLSHLNEREFLSEQGLHSMARTDIAYDQVDIDNGGGGNCTSFPPQIAERLYRSGHTDQADDILRRIMWWGERMPYWGDSLVANSIDYRKDTPLQCTLDGVAVAQCIIFGLFGVDVQFNGDILINPHSPTFAPQLSLKGVRLRGATIDIDVNADGFSVTEGTRTVKAPIGAAILRIASSGELKVVAVPSK